MTTDPASTVFAARLAFGRAHLGLTYRALRAAAGLSHTAVEKLEKGVGSPSLTTCERLATALDVAPAWLAFGVGRAPTWARP